MKIWPRLKDDHVQKIGWRTLVTKTFQDPTGQPAEYVTVSKMGSYTSGVIALTTDNKVIVGEQFRVGPEKIMLEVPAGFSEDGETTQETAERELLEETGYRPGEIEYLGMIYKDAYNNHVWHFYFATNCINTGKQQLDNGEFVTTKVITIEEFLENARTGKMTDSAAVFLAYDRLKKLQGETK